MSLVEARVEARRVLFCLDGNRMRRFRGRRNDARAPLSRFTLRETLLHAVPALECHISVPVNIGSHCTLASFCKGHARTLGFFYASRSSFEALQRELGSFSFIFAC